MTGSKQVLVVIPALNEAPRIGKVIEAVKKNLEHARILVVDDFSRDNTKQIAEDTGAMVLRHPFHLGYGATLQTGYKYALQQGYTGLVQLDADGQHVAAYLPRLLGPVKRGEADVVLGSRYAGVGHYEGPLFKKIGSLLFARLASLLARQRITDPTSGFRALSKKAIAICCADSFPTDFPDADTLVHLKRAGLTIMEIGVEMRASPDKPSMHHGLSQVYYVYKMFLSTLVVMTRGRAKKEN